MSRVLVTGAADGLGQAAARSLLDEGHDVVVHARSEARLDRVRDLLDRDAAAITGDLSDLDEVRGLAEQVERLGPMDAVIHNAGVFSGPDVLAVNVIAPYVLTASIARPQRLVFLSSGMHRGGRADLAWADHGTSVTYSDSKLLLTTLTMVVARRWPDVLSNAVDPGWVPTRMGGPAAPDDLRLGHVTQAWLATSDDPSARTSGGYWHHQRREQPAPAVDDEGFQDRVLEALARLTAVRLS